MKIILNTVILIFCLCAGQIQAQSLRINGTVRDSVTHKGIEFATVSVLAADSSFVKGCATSTGGAFLLENVEPGTYIVSASFLGYKPCYRTIRLAKTDLALDDMMLIPDQTMLKEVVVEGKRPYIRQEIDRYVVNVADLALTAGRNGLDVLRFTPGVIVMNRSVTLLGGSVDVWINGRPSQMDAGALASYLESLQGEDIESVEVITPSARFDAGAGHKIINIRLKKSKVKDVVNGSVNAGYSRSRRDIGFGGISLNYRTEKVNVFGNYNLRGGTDMGYMHEITTELTESRIYDKELNQNVDRRLSQNYRAGVDFMPDTSNVIGVLVSGFGTDMNFSSNVVTRIDPALDNTVRSQVSGPCDNNIGQQAYNLNYQHRFRKKRMLNMDANYAHNTGGRAEILDYRFFAADGQESEPALAERTSSPSTADMWSVKVDYENPVTDAMFFEVGVKAAGVRTDNDFVYEKSTTGDVWQDDPGRSNRFVYDEQIYAAYASWRHKLGKWAYQIGLRGEYTRGRGDLLTTGEVSSREYLKPFPTAFLQYAPSDKHNWVLSYGRTIRRPDYSALNPFRRVLDDYSYMIGNPDLTPSYVHTVELRYMFHQRLGLTLSWGRNNGMVVLNPSFDEEDGRIRYMYSNFGYRSYYGSRVTYNNQFFKFWQINLMGEFSYIINKTLDAGSEIKNEGFMGVFVINNNFRIAKTISAELGFLVLPGQRAGYNEIGTMYNLALGIRKTIMQDKATISLSGNDLLNKMSPWITGRPAGLRIRTYENYNQRSVTLSFDYRFGSGKVKDARRRSVGIEEELGRTQTSSK